MYKILKALPLLFSLALIACDEDELDPPNFNPVVIAPTATPEPATPTPTPEASVLTLEEDSTALVAYFPEGAYTGEANGLVFFQGLSNDNSQTPAISAYLNYSVNVEHTAEYHLRIHYAFGGTETNIRDAWVYVNGEKVLVKGDDHVIEFSYTGQSDGKWNTFSYTEPVTLTLEEGNNDIRIVAVNTPDYSREITYTRDGSGGTEGETGLGTIRGLPNIEAVEITGHGNIVAGDGSNTLYTLIASVGTGDGSLNIDPVQDFYALGTQITLTATAADGFKFDSWQGSQPSNEASLSFAIQGNNQLLARFIANSASQAEELEGFASIQSDAGVTYTLTGGLGAELTTVTNIEELETALGQEGPLTIKISGVIDNAGEPSKSLNVPSNTTLFGDPENQGHIRNIELKLQGENYILRNLVLSEVVAVAIKDEQGTTLVADGRGNDVLSINGAKHVWIDHCELYTSLSPSELYDFAGPDDGPADGIIDENDAKDFYDGLIDIKNGASFITLSNNYFHDHWKAILIGSSDSNDNGTKATRVSLHGNYFENIHSRIPLLRWGKAHFYNNYVTASIDSVLGKTFKVDTVVNLRQGSEALIEGNVIENAADTFGLFHASGNTGFWNLVDNLFIEVESPVDTPTGDYVPPYSSTPIAASEVQAAVINSAGVGLLTLDELQ